MARMILDAAITTDYAQVANSAGIGVLISVTDADGYQYTSLQSGNFEIQLMWDWFEAEGGASEGLFLELAKQSFTGEHIPGIYGLVVWPPGVWSPHKYNLIIRVHEDQNHGQIIRQFTIT